MPAKNTPDPEALTGEKQYQVLQLGESTLSDALDSPIDLGEKLSITRRLLWECSKLHSAKLHQAIIHCDLKPQNILLNPSKKGVLLIDYGLAVSANTTGTLHGTSWYVPVVAGTDPINSSARNFDHGYANRVQGLGTGFDVFSLKRIIRMPAHVDYGIKRCIFRTEEWAQLPDELKQDIAIPDDKAATDQAVQTIRTKHESALDLAMRFVAMEAVNRAVNKIEQEQAYHANLQVLTSPSMTIERQEMVCECAELLDRVQVHDPAQTLYSQQQIIAAAANADPNVLLALKNDLLMQSLLLLMGADTKVKDNERWHTELAVYDPHLAHSLLTECFQKITTTDDPDSGPDLAEQISYFDELIEKLKNSVPSSVSAASDSERGSPISSEGHTSGEDNLSVGTKTSGDSSPAVSVSPPNVKKDGGASETNSSRTLKSRLSRLKTDYIPCLWTDHTQVADPNMIYVKTTKQSRFSSTQIQCMVQGGKDPLDTRVITINPQSIGIKHLSCHLSDKDFETKIIPKIQEIASKIEERPRFKYK